MKDGHDDVFKLGGNVAATK